MIDFDKLERKYNRRLRLRNMVIFMAIYAVLLGILYLWEPEIAKGFVLPVFIAWIVTNLLFR